MQGIAQAVLTIYTVLMAVGGVMGYVTAKSVWSLVSGIVSGVLLAFALVLVRSQPKAGFGLAAGVAAALVLVFGERLMKTHRVMPSGMLLLVSLLAAALFVAAMGKSRGA